MQDLLATEEVLKLVHDAALCAPHACADLGAADRTAGGGLGQSAAVRRELLMHVLQGRNEASRCADPAVTHANRVASVQSLPRP